MPFYEIEERFTRSDLAVVGWRSQETSYKLDQQMKRGHAAAGPPADFKIPEGTTIPAGLPERFFNKDGELDLRQVTGADALKFLRAQGINVPFVPFDQQRGRQPTTKAQEVAAVVKELLGDA